METSAGPPGGASPHGSRARSLPAEDELYPHRRIIDDCADVNRDVRLDDVGFPRPEYCYCDRCNRQFEERVERRHEHDDGPPPGETGPDDRFEWRADLVTEFVTEAARRIPGRVYLTLYPDPYPGHLLERADIDLDALADHVDESVIPLYDMDLGIYYTQARSTDSLSINFNSYSAKLPSTIEHLPNVHVVTFSNDFKSVNIELVFTLLIDEVLTIGIEPVVTVTVALHLEPRIRHFSYYLRIRPAIPSN